MLSPNDDFDNDTHTLNDALLEIFPQLDSLDRFKQAKLRELIMYCVRIKATPSQVAAWPEMLGAKWPMANASPDKFLETFHQLRYGINQKQSANRPESDKERRYRELYEDLGFITPASSDDAGGDGAQYQRVAANGEIGEGVYLEILGTRVS